MMNSLYRICNVQFFGVRKDILTVPLLNKYIYFQDRQFAARKGKRAALLAAKREQKLAEAAKPKATPSFQIRKRAVKPEFEKRRATDENWLETQPIDNVWRTALYRGKPYTFDEVITMYRETHHPSFLNKPNAFIYATVELDTRLKKKNHYLSPFSGVLIYPHEFETAYKNKVIAICRDEDEQMRASEAGAVFTGSSALIKRILSGEILSEDFDYIVCHPDSFKELTVLRGLLKRNFPNANNGLLRLDVTRAVVSFSKGMKYMSEHSTTELDYAWLNVCFGRLSMDTNQLEANVTHLLSAILKHKPPNITFPFITKLMLWCESSFEKYTVPHEEYVSDSVEPTEKSSSDKENVNVEAVQ